MEFVVVFGRLNDTRVKLEFPTACFLVVGGKVVWCVWVKRKRVLLCSRGDMKRSGDNLSVFVEFSRFPRAFGWWILSFWWRGRGG